MLPAKVQAGVCALMVYAPLLSTDAVMSAVDMGTATMALMMLKLSRSSVESKKATMSSPISCLVGDKRFILLNYNVLCNYLYT